MASSAMHENERHTQAEGIKDSLFIWQVPWLKMLMSTELSAPETQVASLWEKATLQTRWREQLWRAGQVIWTGFMRL